MNKVFEKIDKRVIVSCQGNKDQGPFYTPEHMLLLADAAVLGGACGFRANTPPNVKIIKDKYPDYPMIGIYKIVEGDNPVYITPTLAAVEELIRLGSEIVAIDATHRKNARGTYAWELIHDIKEKYPDQIVMADIATIEDARYASKAGADIIATTLSGYTESSKDYAHKANIELIRKIKEEKLTEFIIAEGKLWELADVQAAFEAGANTVVIGTAVNAPAAITRRFVNFAETIHS